MSSNSKKVSELTKEVRFQGPKIEQREQVTELQEKQKKTLTINYVLGNGIPGKTVCLFSMPHLMQGKM